jgi:hypothetical protein
MCSILSINDTDRDCLLYMLTLKLRIAAEAGQGSAQDLGCSSGIYFAKVSSYSGDIQQDTPSAGWPIRCRTVQK